MRTVTIAVPYKSSGGIIRNHQVSFEVHSEDGAYKAVPLLNEDERRVANLPPELSFKMEQGMAKSLRGIIDGNQHVIDAIGVQLQHQ